MGTTTTDPVVATIVPEPTRPPVATTVTLPLATLATTPTNTGPSTISGPTTTIATGPTNVTLTAADNQKNLTVAVGSTITIILSSTTYAWPAWTSPTLQRTSLVNANGNWTEALTAINPGPATDIDSKLPNTIGVLVFPIWSVWITVTP